MFNLICLLYCLKIDECPTCVMSKLGNIPYFATRVKIIDGFYSDRKLGLEMSERTIYSMGNFGSSCLSFQSVLFESYLCRNFTNSRNFKITFIFVAWWGKNTTPKHFQETLGGHLGLLIPFLNENELFDSWNMCRIFAWTTIINYANVALLGNFMCLIKSNSEN